MTIFKGKRVSNANFDEVCLADDTTICSQSLDELNYLLTYYIKLKITALVRVLIVMKLNVSYYVLVLAVIYV